MQAAAAALWRIEYRIDAARADSRVIPVGYMLDAHWGERTRWLGVAYREKLTRAELDLVNLETWPELNNVENFVDAIFDRAWQEESVLGSVELSRAFPIYSALHFAPEPFDISEVVSGDQKDYANLYAFLVSCEDKLVPLVTASIVPFERKSLDGIADEARRFEIKSKMAA
jgi:hypothetical protein